MIYERLVPDAHRQQTKLPAGPSWNSVWKRETRSAKTGHVLATFERLHLHNHKFDAVPGGRQDIITKFYYDPSLNSNACEGQGLVR